MNGLCLQTNTWAYIFLRLLKILLQKHRILMIQCKMLVMQDLRLVIKLMKWMKLKMGWWMATCCDGCNGGWQRCSEQPHSRSMANNYKRIIGMSKFPLTNTSNFLLEFSSITNNW
ncbi:hypothetical protein HanXRQr2_Chr09g0376341 [Helianthus annuus]|uniref:Uncharacterized protein n=2 Tax=Helianthus annuus TaxID=4232 RepID=A0A9K3I4X0_HELAN|nr:hypothetical protein HanXRQr2_Chr09g0376341 [Helianthus annuus]KAJ0892178.1 hypothetical protein HanPSC8_Chr09g0362821 [Helianthus annuus]